MCERVRFIHEWSSPHCACVFATHGYRLHSPGLAADGLTAEYLSILDTVIGVDHTNLCVGKGVGDYKISSIIYNT